MWSSGCPSRKLNESEEHAITPSNIRPYGTLPDKLVCIFPSTLQDNVNPLINSYNIYMTARMLVHTIGNIALAHTA